MSAATFSSVITGIAVFMCLAAFVWVAGDTLTRRRGRAGRPQRAVHPLDVLDAPETTVDDEQVLALLYMGYASGALSALRTFVPQPAARVIVAHALDGIAADPLMRDAFIGMGRSALAHPGKNPAREARQTWADIYSAREDI